MYAETEAKALITASLNTITASAQEKVPNTQTEK